MRNPDDDEVAMASLGDGDSSVAESTDGSGDTMHDLSYSRNAFVFTNSHESASKI